MDSIYKLKGVVQQYSWGGKSFIPSLLGITNVEEKPFAEYWLGAHPASPSFIINGRELLSLYDAIKNDGEAILGNRVKAKYSSLPYLFKVLDVRQMLSIQVHPSKASAIEEYKKETERGIFLTAPNRNYKDQNHKPELMVALSDFWLLHGFKSKIAVEEIFMRVPQLNFLQPIFKSGGYLAMYEEVMTMPQEKVDAILSPLLQEIIPKYEKEILQKSDEHFWAARAALTFCKNRIYDRGIFSIYLFNLLHLKEGEGIYQPAGLPHAYLEGQNVEVMANSDNVLRAGLTDKHVDVAELMKHVQFEATHPKIIMTANDVEQLFEAPVEEFLLKRYQAESTVSWSTETATILFIYDGKATVISDEKNIAVNRGEAVLVLAGKEVSIQPLSGSLSLFSVTTPVDKN